MSDLRDKLEHLMTTGTVLESKRALISVCQFENGSSGTCCEKFVGEYEIFDIRTASLRSTGSCCDQEFKLITAVVAHVCGAWRKLRHPSFDRTQAPYEVTLASDVELERPGVFQSTLLQFEGKTWLAEAEIVGKIHNLLRDSKLARVVDRNLLKGLDEF